MKAKTRRVYRLRKVLEREGACTAWLVFVARFETADDIIAAINGEPDVPIPGDEDSDGTGRAFWVRWFGYEMASSLGMFDEREWWGRAEYPGGAMGTANDDPITPEEAERFRALWVRYADEHGLYEEVPV